MAQWKKLLVSGSNISQLANDAGYLTSVTAQSAFKTASFNGTDLVANDQNGQLNFALTAGTGLSISANAGTDTLTFGLGSIPNNSLSFSSITIAGTAVALGGSISAAAIGAAGNYISSSAQIDHDQTTNFVAGEHFLQSAITTVGTIGTGVWQGTAIDQAYLNGQSGTNTGDETQASINALDITEVGTITSGVWNGTAINQTYLVGQSGTNTGDELPASVTVAGVVELATTAETTTGTDATRAVTPDGLKDGYQGSTNVTTLGTIGTGVWQGTAINQTYLVGQSGTNTGDQDLSGLLLNTTDTLDGTLTITGDLVVQGDQIQANVTNLDIEDKFILLNSGSGTIADSGIVFGGSNGAAQAGAGLIWDASYKGNDGRLAVVSNMASNATGNQTPAYHVAGVFEGTEANAASGQADHVGNILVSGSGEIFIYV